MIFAAPIRQPLGTAASFAFPAPPVDGSFLWAALPSPEASAALRPAFQSQWPEPPWIATPAEAPLGVIALPPAAPGPTDNAPRPPAAEGAPADPWAVSPITFDPPALLPPIPGCPPVAALPHLLIALPDPVRPPADPAALLLPIPVAPPLLVALLAKPLADPGLQALTLLDGLWAAAPLPEWPGLPVPPSPPSGAAPLLASLLAPLLAEWML